MIEETMPGGLTLRNANSCQVVNIVGAGVSRRAGHDRNEPGSAENIETGFPLPSLTREAG